MFAFGDAGKWLINPRAAEVLDLDGSANELDGASGSPNRGAAIGFQGQLKQLIGL